MSANVNNEHYWYEDEGALHQRKSIDAAEELIDEAIEAASDRCHKTNQDISLAEAVSSYVS